MPSQGAHNVIQGLPEQGNLGAFSVRALQSINRFLAQTRLQEIFEIFFAQKIHAVAANASQEGVKQTGSQCPAAQKSERAQQRHTNHASAPAPTFGKAL